MTHETGLSDAQPTGPDGRRADLVREYVAPHVDRGRSAGRIARFREAVLRPDGPHHLGHYRLGVHEFSIGVPPVAARPAAAAPAAAGRDDEAAHARYDEAGRQLGHMAGQLGAMLAPAQTGDLIRVVLHAERGAMFSCSVVPREHVVGLVFGDAVAEGRPLPEAPLVRNADRCVSRLAAELRERIGLPEQNAGGWRTERPGEPAVPPPSPSPSAEGTRVRVFAPDAPAAELVDLCRSALDPRDLVHVAFVSGGRLRFALDAFDSPYAEEHWGYVEARARREFYARFHPRFVPVAADLGHLCLPVVKGRLLRIVLDVEEGAVFYYRMGTGEYLAGVTINQSRVSAADDRMGALALRCAAMAT